MLKPGEIIMTKKDVTRLQLITKVSEGLLIQEKAGKLLNITDRQVRRILCRFRLEGPSSIIHASRGKKSNRQRPEKERKRILKLYKKKYRDFGPTLASEKMEELKQAKISNESLRQLLISEGLWTQKRSRKKNRKYRERKDHFGEMVQMDGSHHDWLEGRGPKMVLMGYVDDATGIAFGRFYRYEGTQPAMDSFRHYIRKYGIPRCVYFDRHSTYKNNNAKTTIDDDLNGREPLSQFGRALKELGVEFIHAKSAPAKGRVERSFNTHQDRLVKEMRLKNIRTIEEANKFLESYYLAKHNKKFSIPPKKEANLHLRGIPRSAIERALSKRTEHTLRNDRTVVHQKKWYQVLNITSAQKVIVEERYNGKMFITYKNKPLKFKLIEKPKKEKILIKGYFKSTGHKPANNNYFKVSNWSYQSWGQYKKEWDENYITKLAENF